jgi:hypothetical protein
MISWPLLRLLEHFPETLVGIYAVVQRVLEERVLEERVLEERVLDQ